MCCVNKPDPAGVFAEVFSHFHNSLARSYIVTEEIVVKSFQSFIKKIMKKDKNQKAMLPTFFLESFYENEKLLKITLS